MWEPCGARRTGSLTRTAARAMRPALLLVLTLVRAAIVPSSLSDRLEQLYEKLEKFAPTNTTIPPELYEKLDLALQTERPVEKLYEKLDRLNSLTPDKLLADDEEDLLDAMQEWGMLDEQIGAVMRELQRRPEAEGEYSDWADEELQELADDDYAMDGSEDADREPPVSPTPAALSRAPAPLSAANALAATNERPRILDDAGLSRSERALLRRAAIANMAAVVQRSRCLTPQPRWLSVRQLAPAADTLYVPPCVQLHRCAPDAGCCYSEAEVCAPVAGQYVSVPLFLNKVDGTLTLARMQFFNHTRCECVSRETLQTSRTRTPRRDLSTLIQDGGQDPSQETLGNARQSDWPTQEPRVESETTAPQLRRFENTPEHQGSSGNLRQSDWPTQEPMLDGKATDSPHLRRCTCPMLFAARAHSRGCACACDWADAARRRDCLSLARGREHFGLRDRVCVARGDCHPPACEHGAYDTGRGRCPLRYRRRFARRFAGAV